MGKLLQHTLYQGCGFGIDVGQDMQAFVAHKPKQEGKKRVFRILTETSIIVLPALKQGIDDHPSPRKLNENKSVFLFASFLKR